MLQEFIQSLCDRIEALSSLSGDDHTLVGVGFCALEDIKKCVSKDKRTIPIIIDNRLLMSIKEYDFNILKDIPDNFALTYFEINRNFHSFVELKDFMTHNLVDNKTMSIYIPITSIFSVNGL
jgi:uncharacterized linocin/CFP29 family protein